MINVSTVVYLLLFHWFVLLLYYIWKRVSQARQQDGADRANIGALRAELKDRGYDDKAIEFWLERETETRYLAAKKMEEYFFRADTLFFMCWAMSLIVLVIVFKK